MVGAVTSGAARMIEATEPRAVVSWAGPGQPILLQVYGSAGEAATVRLSPTRALELAKELIEPAVLSIKTSQWGEGWPG